MKKEIILIATLLLTLVLAVSAHSTVSPADSMTVHILKGESPKTMIIQLSNLENFRTRLNVLDITGHQWFSEVVRDKINYTKNLNLDGMPEGDYFVLVNNPQGFYVKAFEIGEKELIFYYEPHPKAPNANENLRLVSDPKGRFIAHFSGQGNHKIGVRLANLQNQPTYLRLTNVEGAVLYEQKIIHEAGFATKINLKACAPGNYVLQVKACDAEVMQFFTLTKGALKIHNIQRMEHPVSNPIDRKLML